MGGHSETKQTVTLRVILQHKLFVVALPTGIAYMTILPSCASIYYVANIGSQQDDTNAFNRGRGVIPITKKQFRSVFHRTRRDSGRRESLLWDMAAYHVDMPCDELFDCIPSSSS